MTFGCIRKFWTTLWRNHERFEFWLSHPGFWFVTTEKETGAQHVKRFGFCYEPLWWEDLLLANLMSQKIPWTPAVDKGFWGYRYLFWKGKPIGPASPAECQAPIPRQHRSHHCQRSWAQWWACGVSWKSCIPLTLTIHHSADKFWLDILPHPLQHSAFWLCCRTSNPSKENIEFE